MRQTLFGCPYTGADREFYFVACEIGPPVGAEGFARDAAGQNDRQLAAISRFRSLGPKQAGREHDGARLAPDRQIPGNLRARTVTRNAPALEGDLGELVGPKHPSTFHAFAGKWKSGTLLLSEPSESSRLTPVILIGEENMDQIANLLRCNDSF